MRHHRNSVPFWTLPVCIVLSSAVALFAARLARSATGFPGDERQALDLVYNRIRADYVEPRSGKDLMLAAINGMVGTLDRYCAFIPSGRVQAFEEDTTGAYQGIGVVMAAPAPPVTVLFPFVGGPAERAGLQVGDRIVSVEGTSIEHAEAKHVIALARKLLLGPPGSKVALRVRRGDSAPFEVEVTRQDVQKPSVKWSRMLEDRIGYMHLSHFQRHTTRELDASLAQLEHRSAGKLSGLVVDLRFNRGGLLDEAIAVANRFLPDGTIVTLKGRDAREINRHEAVPAECRHPDLPLVVLVNGSSASASEVLAGALQDHHRARLVGTRSYGKGVVQSIFEWRGLGFRLKMTTAYYYTPSGRSIEGRMRRKEDGEARGGILPDLVVTLEKKRAAELRASLQDEWEVPERYREAARRLCKRLGTRFAEPLPISRDRQLQAAVTEIHRLHARARSDK